MYPTLYIYVSGIHHHHQDTTAFCCGHLKDALWFANPADVLCVQHSLHALSRPRWRIKPHSLAYAANIFAEILWTEVRSFGKQSVNQSIDHHEVLNYKRTDMVHCLDKKFIKI